MPLSTQPDRNPRARSAGGALLAAALLSAIAFVLIAHFTSAPAAEAQAEIQLVGNFANDDDGSMCLQKHDLFVQQ